MYICANSSNHPKRNWITVILLIEKRILEIIDLSIIMFDQRLCTSILNDKYFIRIIIDCNRNIVSVEPVSSLYYSLHIFHKVQLECDIIGSLFTERYSNEETIRRQYICVSIRITFIRKHRSLYEQFVSNFESLHGLIKELSTNVLECIQCSETESQRW